MSALDSQPLIIRGRLILEQRRSAVTINYDLSSRIEQSMPETAENIASVKDKLSFIPANGARETWRNMGWGLASLVGMRICII